MSAGHDNGSGAGDGGEGGWEGTCGDVGVVGCAADDDWWVARGDAGGGGAEGAKGRGLGGWAERR